MFKSTFQVMKDWVAIYPIISLIIFFGFFTSMIVVMIKLSPKYVDKMKNLPLEEENDQPNTPQQ